MLRGLEAACTYNSEPLAAILHFNTLATPEELSAHQAKVEADPAKEGSK
jgi:hypothetical protein